MRHPTFPAPPAPEPRHRVVVIGAGPVGLTMALDLAAPGVPCVLVDDNNDAVSTGSRAICSAKRTREIFDRLGVARVLLDSYDAAADENIARSARATRFMSPTPGVERLFRDQVLALAARPFARARVNSGRLSTPCRHPLDAPDPGLPAGARPGSPAPDAPVGNGWLRDRPGRGLTLMALNAEPPEVPGVAPLALPAEGGCATATWTAPRSRSTSSPRPARRRALARRPGRLDRPASAAAPREDPWPTSSPRGT